MGRRFELDRSVRRLGDFSQTKIPLKKASRGPELSQVSVLKSFQLHLQILSEQKKMLFLSVPHSLFFRETSVWVDHRSLPSCFARYTMAASTETSHCTLAPRSTIWPRNSRIWLEILQETTDVPFKDGGFLCKFSNQSNENVWKTKIYATYLQDCQTRVNHGNTSIIWLGNSK